MDNDKLDDVVNEKPVDASQTLANDMSLQNSNNGESLPSSSSPDSQQTSLDIQPQQPMVITSEEAVQHVQQPDLDSLPIVDNPNPVVFDVQNGLEKNMPLSEPNTVNSETVMNEAQEDHSSPTAQETVPESLPPVVEPAPVVLPPEITQSSIAKPQHETVIKLELIGTESKASDHYEAEQVKKRVSIAIASIQDEDDKDSTDMDSLADGYETFTARHERLFKNDLIKSNLYTWFNKPYMGGYKDAKRSVEYFHAVTQTPTAQEKKAKNAPPKFHRDTQTKYFKNRRSQAKEDNATQMEKPGCYISPADDRIIYARKYITADNHEAMVLKKIVQIQCFIRKCFAIRQVRKMRQEKEERRKAVAEKEKRRRELAEKKRKKELDSRLHPRSKKDFEILYNGLENWRKQETKKINNAGYSEAARLTALADLLDQESALIQKIDRLKIAANEENREASVIKLLEKMSSPKKWPVTNKKGGFCLVDTPNTIRARELRDLYHALNIPLLSVDERLQILLHVKYTVKEFDCALTRDIVELIDREGDLVSRGRDAKSLEGLRRRISNLFLQFIQTPEFNPEAKAFQKFPEAGESWKREQAIYYCRGCTKYLPSTEFYLSTTMRHLGRCKDCTMKENIANQRKDDSCYVDMLRYAKTMEATKKPLGTKAPDATLNDYSAISLLQESDIRYLVDIIWNRQSAVSGSKKILDLVLTRWDRNLELSPWNIILLTKEEAHRHETTANVLDLYSEEFTRRVKQRHLAAKKHFGSLPAMEKYLKETYVNKSDLKVQTESNKSENNASAQESDVHTTWSSLKSGHSMDLDFHLSIEGFSIENGQVLEANS